MEHRKIIQALQDADLKNISIEDVRAQLKQLEKFGAMVTTLHPGKRIVRARLTEKKSFENVSALSYKPQEFNSTFQRASTPYKTMFYGSIVPEIQGASEPSTARITVLFEITDFLRDPNSIGELDITFSAWEVIEDIDLISVIHHQKFERPTQLSSYLQEQFQNLVKGNPDLEIQSLEISQFLAREFAKSPISHHTDYTISATYSEIISDSYDGILYPSVRLAGEGINIALKPETVDKKLRFVAASECRVYKNKLETFVDNLTKTEASDGNSLKFTPLEAPYFVGEDYSRKMVGLS
ncbi:RES family NAD+ phosphorylase [Flavobacterium celericrescens]|uniref:RES family NAD+ phosphorylase n=1 Tax=Flavobacterium celericrescens TaxID=2709780 RepID=A0ABX0IGB8_9FLAO|nr:RES family NAD+ phosphorylase [Flavobacterium celericrescens]NHM04321.1 RES family NAD+ phosphorylase [Flavobacterium celericrescens]